jgi:hypothetical protein
MFESASSTLKISISYKNPRYDLDTVPGHEFTLEADMIDASVHAWFEIFEKVLAYQGFSEKNICAGGCQLAFNEYRTPGMMREIAKEYELKMLDYSEPEENSEEE